jgi:gluconolactonase
MTHASLSPGFENLINLDAPITRIGTGFKFTEGPVWHPREGSTQARASSASF